MVDKNKHYPELEANPNFAQQEEDILKYWQENKIFKQSVDEKDNSNQFVFYDGPPFANGLPHYGHLLTGFVKDVVARYQAIKGKKVERRFGWDCHGLPAEMGAEKELGISGRHKIIEHGIENFNQHCQTSVMQFSGQWEKYVNRQARWVDFENDYRTMDKGYMESVLWAFKQLYDKGLVYESMRVMPYSWACETPLSNFETKLDNSYRERADKAATVGFKLKNKPVKAPKADEYRVLAWTTTPWTLPSNLALAVGEDIEYVFVKSAITMWRHGDKGQSQDMILTEKGEGFSLPIYTVEEEGVIPPYASNTGARIHGVSYLIARSSLKNYQKELKLDDNKLEEYLDTNYSEIIKGSELVGLEYEPLFPYFKDHQNAFKILSGDFVEEGDGTGIVHLAPGFGEDDQRVCEDAGIKLVCPVDNGGNFTEQVKDFSGRNVLQCNDDVIKHLKKQGSWLKTEQYIHNYPHCWRTDEPLIYKAVPSWYVEVTKFKDRMVELNQEINWIPSHIKDGQFGKWLENARDWSISRNRFWGSPIPIWKSDNPDNNELYVFGSIAELEEFFETKVEDLHRPFIDNLTKPDPLDSQYTLTRVEDVFDCWFESGSMPYAQVHYPFENKDWFEDHFPADFIVEYVAQTRGWFYTLMVLSTALFDRPPFLNCICHGVVLDGKGQKLSKRLQNYADPMDVFNKFGSDAMRWVMMSAPIMQGGELLIDKEGNMIRDAVRLVLKPIWNAYNFFCLYANSDGVKAEFSLESQNVMDRYIIAKCKTACINVDEAMSAYDTQSSCKAIEQFFEVLNNWYIRRNKERFWKSQHDEDKITAYNTLLSVLQLMCRVSSPLLPILTENIWQGLGEKSSVHLNEFPQFDNVKDDAELITAMDKVQDVCNVALSIRNAENIRIRQPLLTLTIVDENLQSLKDFVELIKDEINIKHVKFESNIAAFASYKLKINFPVLGKRLPAKMKQIIPASKKGDWSVNSDGLVEILGETLTKQECQLQLEPKDKKGAMSLSSNNALVMLDLNLNDELVNEGIARDLVRIIQQSRKDANLDISAKINLSINASQRLTDAINDFKDYICKQTLSLSLDVANDNSLENIFNHKLDGEEIKLSFSIVL